MQKTVLITGATGGIGYELAKIFANEKYNLVIVARNKEHLIHIKENLERKHKIRVFIIAKDLTEKDASDEIFNTVTHHNIDINILVNNAGFGDFGEFCNAEWQKQYEMIQVNIVAMIHMTKLFLKPMIEKGTGKILNTASIAAFQPGPLMSVYYASKAFVLSFSEALSKELINTGVTVTALCPGPTKTGFEEKASLSQSKLFKTLKVADSYAVAKFGYKELMKGTPVAVHGMLNKLLVIGSRIAPRSLVREIVYRLQSKCT